MLSTFWYDGYAVNGYGIYYLRGATLYVQVHETGERIKLYTCLLYTSLPRLVSLMPLTWQ